jgi:hypothetical protein
MNVLHELSIEQHSISYVAGIKDMTSWGKCITDEEKAKYMSSKFIGKVLATRSSMTWDRYRDRCSLARSASLITHVLQSVGHILPVLCQPSHACNVRRIKTVHE